MKIKLNKEKLIYCAGDNGYHWEVYRRSKQLVHGRKTFDVFHSQLFKTKRGAELSQQKGKLRWERL